jgi:hypothetical protein
MARFARSSNVRYPAETEYVLHVQVIRWLLLGGVNGLVSHQQEGKLHVPGRRVRRTSHQLVTDHPSLPWRVARCGRHLGSSLVRVSTLTRVRAGHRPLPPRAKRAMNPLTLYFPRGDLPHVRRAASHYEGSSGPCSKLVECR